MVPERFDMPPSLKAAWACLTVALVGFGIKMALDQPRIDGPTIMAVSIALVLAGMCLRLSRCRVEVTGAGIRVHNPVRTRTVPWKEFIRIEERVWFRYQPDAFLVRLYGRPILLFALSQRSWGADPFHERLRAIDAAIDRSRAGSSDARR